MATLKQIAANRLNSTKNTAPHTAEAKAASRYNALKHGIYSQQQVMFDENAEDLAELDAELRDQYQPQNPTERALVDTLVHNEWRLRRMRRVEAVLWEHAANAYLTEHPEEAGCNSADAFVAKAGPFERLQRIVNSCERNYHRALKELVARAHGLRQEDPNAADLSPQSQEIKPTSQNLAPFRQNPNPPVPAPPPAARNARAILSDEAVDDLILADESLQIRKQAIFADAMAKYGKK